VLVIRAPEGLSDAELTPSSTAQATDAQQPLGLLVDEVLEYGRKS
jgi:hypothetical protein